MMRDKLNELTEKLYNEGLSKGQKEGEEIIAKARQDAATIIEDANEEALAIISRTKKEAEELASRVEGDIKMASVQAISAIRQKIESELLSVAVKEPIKAALGDKDFLQSVIVEIVKSFNPESGVAVSLEVLLPEVMKDEMDNYLRNNISGIFKGELDFKFDKSLSSGFKIGPKDGSYYLSFTQKDFEALFSAYLRPLTRKIVFDK